ASDPVAIVDQHNVIRVFVRGADAHLYERHHTATAGWSGWTSLGTAVAVTGRPHAVVDNSNTVRVYVHNTGASGHIWEVYLLNGPGHTWGNAYLSQDSTGFILATGYDPVAIADKDGIIRVYASEAGQLWERFLLPGSAWSNWSSLGGTVTGDAIRQPIG